MNQVKTNKMENEKLDQDPTGMSKRFYAACAAMSIQESLLPITLQDEDFIEDENGSYVKGNYGYHFPNDITHYHSDTRYKLIASWETRLVRSFYKVADELLKQENI